MKTLILALLVALLVVSNLYIYVYFNSLNGYLRFTLQQISMSRKQVLGEYNALEKYAYHLLSDSYTSVVEANERLREVLNSLYEDLGKIPYNYTLMNYFEFMGKFTFAYTDEMRDFVFNVTGGWNGTDEDFRSDLYEIYRAWRSAFKYDTPVLGEFLFINLGIFNYDKVEIYSLEEGRWITLDYLREVPSGYEINRVHVSGASISFSAKQGMCWDFAVVLVSLYYAYYDIAGKSLPTAYISIRGIDGDPESHAVVLIKLEGDMVAIMDWEMITPLTDGMVEFVPFETAKKLHVEYWRQVSFKKPSDILYKGFMKGRPYEYGIFHTNEEFYEWLVNQLK